MLNNHTKGKVQNRFFPILPHLNQERTQKFFGIALTLLALSFFGFFAINPTVLTILKLQKEVSDSKFVYNELETKIKNLSLLRKEYAGLQNDLFIIKAAIPSEPNAHLLFAQIQAIASESNVKIKKLQNFEVEVLKNSKAPGKPYYSYSFSISGSSSFGNILSFVSAIRNMQRIIDMEVFGITNQDSQTLVFNMQGTAFFQD